MINRKTGIDTFFEKTFAKLIEKILPLHPH
jgi:hypothetical protein